MYTMLASQRYLRRVVHTVPCPDWTALEQGPRPWLYLRGSDSETLQKEVHTVSDRVDQQWMLHSADQERGVLDYPLLVPLDEPLYAHAMEHWLRQQTGLIVLGPDDGDTLVRHLQRLHTVTASDGFPVGFSPHAMRALEELCEALPAERLAKLLGPIQRLVWYSGDLQTGEWLCANAPLTALSATADEMPADDAEVGTPALTLTESDEAALDQASHAWFMRDCVREFRQRFAAYATAEQQPLLWKHLAKFAHEACAPLGFTTERDMRHYMALRLTYPSACFAEDSPLWEILMAKQLEIPQRLSAAQEQLQAWTQLQIPLHQRP